jgi:protein-disulfide isomerase
MLLPMHIRGRALHLVPFLLLFLACSQSSAQSPRDAEALRKEIEALKAQQAEMQKSLEEIRDFLRQATGGRFGAPSLVNTIFDISGLPSRGDARAPVTLIEVSDYHCPFCRRHVQQTQPRIYSELVDKGKVRHVFVHYPIAQLHPDAHLSHEAALCANDQGKFWEMHTKLFETPLKTSEQLTGLAQGAGLDVTAFRACLDSGKHTKEVQASVDRIAKMNVSGTPMFFVARSSGDKVTIAKVVEGAQPFEAFQSAVDEVAKGK